MAGTRLGGIKAAATNKARYGADFYRRVGKIGGIRSRGGGFAYDRVGPDGLTGPERASIAGARGGAISRKPR